MARGFETTDNSFRKEPSFAKPSVKSESIDQELTATKYSGVVDVVLVDVGITSHNIQKWLIDVWQTEYSGAQIFKDNAEELVTQLPRAIAFAVSPEQGQIAQAAIEKLGGKVKLALSAPNQNDYWSASDEAVNLVLIETGTSVIEVIKEIRRLTGFDLTQSKDLLSKLPSPIKTRLSHSEASILNRGFQSLGATSKIEILTRVAPNEQPPNSETELVLPNHFDPSFLDKIEQQIGSTSDQHEKIDLCRSAYVDRLLPDWRDFIQETNHYAIQFDKSRAAEIEEAKADAESKIASINLGLNKAKQSFDQSNSSCS